MKTPRVTEQVAQEVITRDLRIAGGCVPKWLGAPGDCRDRWNNIVRPDAREALTLDHIREHLGGQRRSEPRWMVTACWGHHILDSWGNRDALRVYLAAV